jgi:hypothetical protein
MRTRQLHTAVAKPHEARQAVLGSTASPPLHSTPRTWLRATASSRCTRCNSFCTRSSSASSCATCAASGPGSGSTADGGGAGTAWWLSTSARANRLADHRCIWPLASSSPPSSRVSASSTCAACRYSPRAWITSPGGRARTEKTRAHTHTHQDNRSISWYSCSGGLTALKFGAKSSLRLCRCVCACVRACVRDSQSCVPHLLDYPQLSLVGGPVAKCAGTTSTHPRPATLPAGASLSAGAGAAAANSEFSLDTEPAMVARPAPPPGGRGWLCGCCDACLL